MDGPARAAAASHAQRVVRPRPACPPHAHDHVLRAPTALRGSGDGATGHGTHHVTQAAAARSCTRLREPSAPLPLPRLWWALVSQLVHGGGRRGLLVMGPLLDGAVCQPQHDAVEPDEDGRDRRAQQRLRAGEVAPRPLDDEVAEGVGAAQEVVAARLVRVRVRVRVRVGVRVMVGVGVLGWLGLGLGLWSGLGLGLGVKGLGSGLGVGLGGSRRAPCRRASSRRRRPPGRSR